MNLYQDTQTEQFYDYKNHLIDMIGLILQQKFQKLEIGEFDVGNLFVENQLESTNSLYYKCRSDVMNQVNQDAENIWLAYFDFFFPAEDNFIIEPDLFHTLTQNNPNKVYFFFQKTRPQNTGKYKWHFSTAKLSLLNDETYPSILFRYAFELNKSEIKARSEDDENYFQMYCNRFMLLSKREKEVIKLIVGGKSSHEISDLLFLSIHTVNNHRKNITNKLQISNLCQLTRFALLFDIA